MDLNLSGKTALVIGASQGIGFSIVERLLEEGAAVFACSRSGNNLAEAKRKLMKNNESAKFEWFICDASSDSARLTISNFLHGRHIDLVFVVAGSGSPSNKPLGESIHIGLKQNLIPLIGTIEACLEYLEKSPVPSVTFISSIAGTEFIGAPLEYALAKSAAHLVIRDLSKKNQKIRFNAVAAGNVNSENSVWRHRLINEPELVDLRNVPLYRLGTPEEISAMAVFIGSPASSFVTGTVVVVDGGQTNSFL